MLGRSSPWPSWTLLSYAELFLAVPSYSELFCEDLVTRITMVRKMGGRRVEERAPGWASGLDWFRSVGFLYR